MAEGVVLLGFAALGGSVGLMVGFWLSAVVHGRAIATLTAAHQEAVSVLKAASSHGRRTAARTKNGQADDPDHLSEKLTDAEISAWAARALHTPKES